MMDGFDLGQLHLQSQPHRHRSRRLRLPDPDRGARRPARRDAATSRCGPIALRHHACYTCYQYGALCANPSGGAARCLTSRASPSSAASTTTTSPWQRRWRDAQRRGVEAVYCLGDLGAFGPHPDRVFPLLREHGVQCIQGNYDNSIGNGLADCQCGYTDPRDNHFARISYDYTSATPAPPTAPG